ncbi:MAG: GAF domain-containing protein, partial [Planctomycetes bacterium]|nr:GAF domain-containing protein [Planctomycetota bacterium]
MTTRHPEPAQPTEAWLDTRQARRRSSLMLFTVLALGAVAAILSTTALMMAPASMTIGRARAHGLAFVAASVALVLIAAAFWQLYLVRAAARDCVRLQRTVDALRRREAYDEAEFALMTRINGLIEVFTHTRDLQAVLNEAVRTLQSTLHVHTVTLRLQDEEVGELALSTEEGAAGLALGAETRRAVLTSGKSFLVNALAANPAYKDLANQGYSALMAAPLGRGRRATDRSVGFIAALNKGDRDFTGRELTLLTHFARHAGLIIENAQLYKRAEHLAEHDGLTNL